MLLYVALCLAAALAPSLEEEIPTFSPVFSIRVEQYNEEGRRIYSKIWVDKTKNFTREDLLEGQEQNVFKMYDEDFYNWTTVHRVFPVTTEEHANVRKCFIVANWDTMFFADPLYTLPDLKEDGFYFDGLERVHGEDATKWTIVIPPLGNWTRIFSIWVANRDGVSVPLRQQHTSIDDYFRTSTTSYKDYYDYDTSDIDPEVFNIGAGLNCKYAATSDAENSDLIEDATPTKDLELNYFDNFDGISYMNGFNVEELRYKLKMKQILEHKRDHSDQSHASESSETSKALPFPYSAEEVERLSQALPEQFDWRLYGAVGTVRTPHVALYAEAAAAMMQSALFIRNGMEVMVSISSQAIEDCSWGFGNRGSNGGSVEASLLWAMKHGVPAEDVYPYTGINDYCRIDEVEKITKVKSYYNIPPNDEMALRLAIVNHGPIAVFFDGWCISLFQYRHGVFSDPTCRNSPATGNAQGLIVGYGVLEGVKYWILNAFLGHDFGIDGYVLMGVSNNTCGVMNSPLFITLE